MSRFKSEQVMQQRAKILRGIGRTRFNREFRKKNLRFDRVRFMTRQITGGEASGIDRRQQEQIRSCRAGEPKFRLCLMPHFYLLLG